MFINKNFGDYYNKILDVTKNNNKAYIKDFLGSIADLNYEYIDKHMKLIDEDKNIVQVYLARKIVDINGDLIDGKEIWKQYVNLWKMKCSIDYAEWKVKMSIITSKMNYFIYQIDRNCRFDYDKQIGDLYYIDDGEKYMKYGKLDMAIFDTEKELFI